MSYYLCRRSFRDAKGPVSAGSVVDPASIKRFRYRKQEGHIVEVNEQNFEKYATLMKVRYHVDIPSLNPIIAESIAETLEKPVKEVEKTKPVKVAKATTKVVSK